MAKQGKKCETAAVIDIASSELRLKISERQKDFVKTLETLVYPLNFGRDTFNTGKISFDKVDITCQTIKNFLTVISEYDVTKIRAIATTAVREATNKEYILDQIKIKTGLEFEVIDDKQEKIYIDQFVIDWLDQEYTQSALMVNMGSGSIGISVIEKGHVVSTYTIRIGSLRIYELFEDIMNSSSNYSLVLEEYLKSYIKFIEDHIPKGIQHFIAMGNEIEVITKLCVDADSVDQHVITKQSFAQVYKEIKGKPIDAIMADYGLSEERALVLTPSLIVFNKMFKMTKSDKIMTSSVFLNDALLFEMLFPEQHKKISHNFENNIILSAISIAEHFGYDEEHSRLVEKFALKIFDKLKKVHGLGERERIYLQASCILHDIGKFVNVKNHHLHSLNIINGIDIVGVNVAETAIIANVCYYHAKLTPSPSDTHFASLKTKDRLTVSKLCSIIRLANSLNQSHNTKFDDIDVKMDHPSGEMIITVQTSKNIELEHWSFYDKALFFNEVFGIKATIRKKVN